MTKNLFGFFTCSVCSTNFKGYRTLCFAYRELDLDFYNEWSNEYREASVSMKGREKMVADCAERIENSLHLIGASAIEDKLQEVIFIF